MGRTRELRTPYSRVTGMGSTGSGTGHFWRQRLTGLANIPLTLFLVWLVTRLAGGDRSEIIELLSCPLNSGLTVLALGSVFWHMALGMQVVIEDYVHAEGPKTVLIILNKFFALALAGLSIVAVLKLSFGG